MAGLSGIRFSGARYGFQRSAFAILRSQSKHLVASRTIIVYQSNKMLRSGSAKCDLAARTFTHNFEQAHPIPEHLIPRHLYSGKISRAKVSRLSVDG